MISTFFFRFRCRLLLFLLLLLLLSGYAQVERVRRRRYRLRESALEVFMRRGKRRSLFVDFGSEPRDQGRRNDFIRALETRVGGLWWHGVAVAWHIHERKSVCQSAGQPISQKRSENRSGSSRSRTLGRIIGRFLLISRSIHVLISVNRSVGRSVGRKYIKPDACFSVFSTYIRAAFWTSRGHRPSSFCSLLPPICIRSLAVIFISTPTGRRMPTRGVASYSWMTFFTFFFFRSYPFTTGKMMPHFFCFCFRSCWFVLRNW